MSEFDSIIPPGQTGRVTQQIKTSRLGDGKFSKYVKVMSNARNSRVLKLSMIGRVVTPISFHPKALVFQPDLHKKAKGTVTLSSEKGDLVIDQISFEKSKNDEPSWQKEQLFLVSHSIKRSDTTDKDGFWDYALDLSFEYAPHSTMSGYFFISTNHPEVHTVKYRIIIKPIQTSPPETSNNKTKKDTTQTKRRKKREEKLD